MPGCGDQRRLTGNCSALEALRDDALHKSTLHYLTLLRMRSYVKSPTTFWRLRSTIEGQEQRHEYTYHNFYRGCPYDCDEFNQSTKVD